MKAENSERFKKDSLTCNETADFKDDITVEEQTKPQKLPQTEVSVSSIYNNQRETFITKNVSQS